MALIKCKECGKEISDQAKTCPNCGAKTEFAKYKQNTIIFILIFIFILSLIGIGIFFMRSNNPLHKYSQEAITILEKYSNDELTSKEADDKLSIIYNYVDKDYNGNDDVEYLSLRTLLSSIKLAFHDGFNDIGFKQVNEYIEKLQKY